jgi:hypothetical protein
MFMASLAQCYVYEICLCAYDSSSFILIASHFHSMKILHLFLIYSLIDRQLSCFQDLAITKKASMKTFMHAFWYS